MFIQIIEIAVGNDKAHMKHRT